MAIASAVRCDTGLESSCCVRASRHCLEFGAQPSAPGSPRSFLAILQHTERRVRPSAGCHATRCVLTPSRAASLAIPRANWSCQCRRYPRGRTRNPGLIWSREFDWLVTPSALAPDKTGVGTATYGCGNFSVMRLRKLWPINASPAVQIPSLVSRNQGSERLLLCCRQVQSPPRGRASPPRSEGRLEGIRAPQGPSRLHLARALSVASRANKNGRSLAWTSSRVLSTHSEYAREKRGEYAGRNVRTLVTEPGSRDRRYYSPVQQLPRGTQGIGHVRRLVRRACAVYR